MSHTNNDTNQIGLEKADMSEVIAQLNNLLSSYHVLLYQRPWLSLERERRAFLFTLHPKFEELYTDATITN